MERKVSRCRHRLADVIKSRDFQEDKKVFLLTRKALPPISRFSHLFFSNSLCVDLLSVKQKKKENKKDKKSVTRSR